jgi:hypothetical protein
MKYEMRLGDIIRMFPACKLLADQGHEVFFYTRPEYKSIFELVTYVRWVDSPKSVAFDRFLDPQIFPGRYGRYRDSKKTWKEFAYSTYPDIEPAMHHSIVFDREVAEEALEEYDLPAQYALISPFGHSQIVRPSVEWCLAKIREIVGNTQNIFMLSDEKVESPAVPVITASNLSHLAPIIAKAKEFLTINSSPSIIASVVRKSYYHVYLPDYDGLDDYSAENQIVLRH